MNLGLLCHTALAWLFPWGWATAWQIKNWSRHLTLCEPSACIYNYHPLKRWLLAVCCSFLHCHWPGSAGYLPTVLPWRYPAQTHSPSLPWNPLRSCWEACWSNACWFLAGGGGWKPVFFFQKPSVSVWGDAYEYRTPYALSFLVALEWSPCQLCVKDPEIHGTMSKIDLPFWCGFWCGRVQACFL